MSRNPDVSSVRAKGLGLCQQISKEVQANLLQVDTEQITSKHAFSTRSTVSRLGPVRRGPACEKSGFERAARIVRRGPACVGGEGGRPRPPAPGWTAGWVRSGAGSRSESRGSPWLLVRSRLPGLSPHPATRAQGARPSAAARARQVGLMLNGTTVDNTVVGGPAFNTRKLEQVRRLIKHIIQCVT